MTIYRSAFSVSTLSWNDVIGHRAELMEKSIGLKWTSCSIKSFPWSICKPLTLKLNWFLFSWLLSLPIHIDSALPGEWSCLAAGWLLLGLGLWACWVFHCWLHSFFGNSSVSVKYIVCIGFYPCSFWLRNWHCLWDILFSAMHSA